MLSVSVDVQGDGEMEHAVEVVDEGVVVGVVLARPNVLASKRLCVPACPRVPASRPFRSSGLATHRGALLLLLSRVSGLKQGTASPGAASIADRVGG